MLDDTAVSLNTISAQVGNLGEIRVGGQAVVALVVVVSQELPVVVASHLPSVVELVVVKVVVLQPLRLIDASKLRVPGNLRPLTSIEVHPDEAGVVNVNMDREEAVDRLVEAGEVLVARGFGQLAVKPVGPAVVLARESALSVSGILALLDNGERAVPTDIVESVDLSCAVLCDDEFEPGNLIAKPVSRLSETDRMCNHHPSLAEDGSALELIHFWRGVPRAGKGSDTAGLLFGWGRATTEVVS